MAKHFICTVRKISVNFFSQIIISSDIPINFLIDQMVYQSTNQKNVKHIYRISVPSTTQAKRIRQNHVELVSIDGGGIRDNNHCQSTASLS